MFSLSFSLNIGAVTRMSLFLIADGAMESFEKSFIRAKASTLSEEENFQSYALSSG